MKTLTSDQIASISGETTTLARLLQITDALGNDFYFTDCDIDLIVDGHTYLHNVGFDISALVLNLGTNTSSCSVDLLLSDDGINRAKLESGVLDNAKILLSLVDWLTPSRGKIDLFPGNAQTFEYKDAFIVTFDIEPLLSRDLQLNVDVVSSNCRVDLGSTQCGIDIDALKKTCTIATVANLQQFNTDLTDIDDTWDNGLFVFTSGQNEGIALEVGSFANTNGQVTLALLAPYAIASGDTGTIYPGCDKTPATCSATYLNMINFRGEPWGLNQQVAAQTASTTTAATTPPMSIPVCIFVQASPPKTLANFANLELVTNISGTLDIVQNPFNADPPTDPGHFVCVLYTGLSFYMYTGQATKNIISPTGLPTNISFYPDDATIAAINAGNAVAIEAGIISNHVYGSATPNRDLEAVTGALIDFTTVQSLGHKLQTTIIYPASPVQTPLV